MSSTNARIRSAPFSKTIVTAALRTMDRLDVQPVHESVVNRRYAYVLEAPGTSPTGRARIDA